MGCLLMVSCGSDSDSDAPRGSDPISGSWKIISATENGAPVGAVFTFSGTSSVKMTGTESTGTYSYNASTGAISLSVDGKSISGTIVFDGDNATLTYDSGNGVETVMLQKESGSGGEGGDASSLMMGSWVIKSTTVPGGSANETVIFGDENVYKVSGIYLSHYSFSGSEAANIFAIYDLFGYDELQGEIVFSKNGKGAQQAEISCYNPDGDPNVKWIIRMTKFSDYNLPSESPTASKPYLGDWMLQEFNVLWHACRFGWADIQIYVGQPSVCQRRRKTALSILLGDFRGEENDNNDSGRNNRRKRDIQRFIYDLCVGWRNGYYAVC